MRWSSTSWLMSPALTASLANAKMSSSELYSCRAILETLLLAILFTLVLGCATQVALFGHIRSTVIAWIYYVNTTRLSIS